jgi:hypothetical protein
MKRRLDNKRAFYRLWHAGAFGNKIRAWSRPEEVPQDFTGRIMLRAMNSPGGSALNRELPAREAVRVWKEDRAAGRLPEWQGNETAPDDRAMLQGEILRDHEGLQVFATPRKAEDVGKLLRMRDVMPFARQYTGLAAVLLLRRYLDPASLETVEELLNEWPDHVIEFTAFDGPLGTHNRNTIIWEVRAY